MSGLMGCHGSSSVTKVGSEASLLNFSTWDPLQGDASRRPSDASMLGLPSLQDLEPNKSLLYKSLSLWCLAIATENGLKQRLCLLKTHEDILSISVTLLNFKSNQNKTKIRSAG